MSDNVFIGGTGLADTARQLQRKRAGSSQTPAKPMAPQAFIKLKNILRNRVTPCRKN